MALLVVFRNKLYVTFVNQIKKTRQFLGMFFWPQFWHIFLTKPTAASKKQAENLTKKLKEGNPIQHLTHTLNNFLKTKNL